MKKLIGILLCMLSSSVIADTAIEPLLNKVTLQFTAEQWAATKTALVNININVAVSDKGLEKIHSQVIAKLNSLSKQDWHLISYERTQDKSGLESVQITAQARLPETELSGLRDKTKAVSRPGETYTIDSIQFSPSESEMRDAQNILRENIYQQAKAELARLNRIYPDQKYTIHDINFISMVYPMAAQNVMLAKADGSKRSPLVVSDKLNLSATVVLAASPDPALIKAAHE